jgi:hypothetical protein
MKLSRGVHGALAALALFALACNNDDITGPPQPLGVTATATGNATVNVAWTSVAGDSSYTIERAPGATGGTFVEVGSVVAPATVGPVKFTDTGLSTTSTYRYRVIAHKNGKASSPSTEAVVTTLTSASASVTINTDITTSRTLYADTSYLLSGFIHVTNGATLTIQPGTTIKGDFNTLGSSIMIMRGAKINAVGTAAAPIVFTSSRAPGQRQPGDWGGLLFVGNAIDNRSGVVNVEGTGTDGSAVVGGKNYFVQYNGGNTATDNSGTMQYVRVEFAGFAPIQDQEFNSFTFAAIGSGTRFSYLESLCPLDDAFEFFGGGFDIDHIIAYETADDMFDMSEGWVGRMQYLIGINTVQLTPRTGAGFYSVDIEGIENDGCNGTGCDNGFDQQPFTIPLVANFTMIGCGSSTCVGASGGHGMMLRRGTGGYYVNGVVVRWPTDGISLRDNSSYVRGGSTATPSATADLQLKNIYFAEDNNLLFQANTATPATQFSLDPTANALTLAANTVTAASLFVKIPAVGAAPTDTSAFDFTPAAGSAIATGGLATLAGAVATKGGTFITGTAFQGGAPLAGTLGARWWAGWTIYARN